MRTTEKVAFNKQVQADKDKFRKSFVTFVKATLAERNISLEQMTADLGWGKEITDAVLDELCFVEDIVAIAIYLKYDLELNWILRKDEV